MRIPVSLAACAAALSVPVLAQDAPGPDRGAAEAPSYVWHAYTADSVAYGVPETDDRVIRIDCDAGRMVLMAAVDPEIVEDGKVQVIAWGPGGMDMIEAGVAEMGDGLNFVAPLPRRSDALAGLMAGKDITLMLKGEEWTVPGGGAPPVLGPLARRCGG